jgi:hypothetical protein
VVNILRTTGEKEALFQISRTKKESMKASNKNQIVVLGNVSTSTFGWPTGRYWESYRDEYVWSANWMVLGKL